MNDAEMLEYQKTLTVKLGWRPHGPVIGPWDGLSVQTPQGSVMKFGWNQDTTVALRALAVAGFPFPLPRTLEELETIRREAEEEARRKIEWHKHRHPKGVCHVYGCENYASDFHHVTYRPVAGFYLCPTHHKEITVCNTNGAERSRKKLSNKHRWWIWNQWLNGELTPRYTANAMRYLETWRDYAPA